MFKVQIGPKMASYWKNLLAVDCQTYKLFSDPTSHSDWCRDAGSTWRLLTSKPVFGSHPTWPRCLKERKRCHTEARKAENSQDKPFPVSLMQATNQEVRTQLTPSGQLVYNMNLMGCEQQKTTLYDDLITAQSLKKKTHTFFCNLSI